MKALYLDAEYTCWEGDPPLGMARQVIQLGIVSVDLKELAITRQGSYYIRPHMFTEVSDYCTELTGISALDIKREGKKLGDVLNTLGNNYSLKRTSCYTWGSEGLLKENIEQIGRSNPFQLVDLSIQFYSYFPQPNMSLTKALEYMGLKFEGRAHNALVDAYNLARLHTKMIQEVRLARGI